MAEDIRLVPNRATLEEIVNAMLQLPRDTGLEIQSRGIRAAAAVVRRRARQYAPQSTKPRTNRGRNIYYADGALTRNLYSPFPGALRKSIGLKAFRTGFRDPGASPQIVKIPRGKYRVGTAYGTESVFWGLFQEQGTRGTLRTRHVRIPGARGVHTQRYRSGAIPPHPYLGKAFEDTKQQQFNAFVKGAARGIVSLERRLKAGKPTRRQMKAFMEDLRYGERVRNLADTLDLGANFERSQEPLRLRGLFGGL